MTAGVITVSPSAPMSTETSAWSSSRVEHCRGHVGGAQRGDELGVEVEPYLGTACRNEVRRNSLALRDVVHGRRHLPRRGVLAECVEVGVVHPWVRVGRTDDDVVALAID